METNLTNIKIFNQLAVYCFSSDNRKRMVIVNWPLTLLNFDTSIYLYKQVYLFPSGNVIFASIRFIIARWRNYKILLHAVFIYCSNIMFTFNMQRDLLVNSESSLDENFQNFQSFLIFSFEFGTVVSRLA